MTGPAKTVVNGRTLRWHAPPDFTECSDPDCDRIHATLAELANWIDGAEAEAER